MKECFKDCLIVHISWGTDLFPKFSKLGNKSVHFNSDSFFFFPQLRFFYRVWTLIQMEHMAHHTPLALGQILPHILGLITHLDILRPITPQRFQALTVHLETAQPQSLVGCILSRTARLKHLLLGLRFQDILHHRWALFCWVCIF